MELIVNSSQGKYKIISGRNILKKVNYHINLKRQVMIISDDNIPKEYINTVLKQCDKGYTTIIKNGEKSKDIKTYHHCLKQLLKHKFSRNDLIIALGGGVVGDLAGFVASTYKRGIDFVNIPTSTLSQIDSSIGGKVGINMSEIKNCVGAFYQPKLVLIDFSVLKTLNKRRFNEGLVEAIKAGLIKDESLFELFEKPELDIEKIIEKALIVKKYFVEKDEKEKNIRKILNFGHSIGHAYESYFNFDKYFHGECVAMGMMAILENETIKKRLKNILDKLNINPLIVNDKEKLFEFIKNDKKAYENKIDIIKVNKIGKAYIETVDLDYLRSKL